MADWNGMDGYRVWKKQRITCTKQSFSICASALFFWVAWEVTGKKVAKWHPLQTQTLEGFLHHERYKWPVPQRKNSNFSCPCAGGESWLSLPGELSGGEFGEKIFILLWRQKSQLDHGMGSAWIAHQPPPKPRLPTSNPVKTQTGRTHPIYPQ